MISKSITLLHAQDHAKAQFNLGCAYSRGVGVTVNRAESVKWYRLAAKQGLANAQFNMGVAYGNGEGVDIDVVKGMKWMKLASENGFPQAIKFLES
jgi:TPR repeat protein